MSSLHPIFEAIFASHGISPNSAQELQARRVAYISALRKMDWEFEFSDDHIAWARGRAELERLRGERDLIDKDGAIWREHAHADFR